MERLAFSVRAVGNGYVVGFSTFGGTSAEQEFIAADLDVVKALIAGRLATLEQRG